MLIFRRAKFSTRAVTDVEVDVTLCCGAFGRAASQRRQHRRTRSHRTPRRRQETFRRQGRAESRQKCHRRHRAKLIGLDPYDQLTVDATMLKLDGTERSRSSAPTHPRRITGNAKAAPPAEPAAVPLSRRRMQSVARPMANVINGGAHSDARLISRNS